MKKLLLITFALLIFAPAFTNAQKLHPSFTFAREPNKSGSIIYVLKADVEGIDKKFGVNMPHQILGAVARIENQRAVLMFLNAQKEFQLANQANKSVVITADSSEIKNLVYEVAAKSEDDSDDPIKMEIVNVMITFKDLESIMNAKSVTAKFGPVIYKLDKDNIDAFHYLAAEIEKDQKKIK